MTVNETLRDIREHPERHKHYDLNGLNQCAFVDGSIHLAIIDAHAGLHGRNGGEPCDVANGPCSCGAWH